MTYAIERIFDDAEEQGFKKGIERGIERGIEQGIEQGIEEGIDIGRQERNIELAKLMMADGEPLEKIAKWTSLSLSTLKDLQK